MRRRSSKKKVGKVRRDTARTGTRIKIRERERAKGRESGRDIAFSPCSNLDAFKSTSEGIRRFHCQ